MTPLVLITGSLGAGKTSLLRAVIPELAGLGLKPTVVLNDYANARVDAATLADLEVEVEPISGSCVCCDSMDELFFCLEDFQIDEETVVLLEANGTTDPGPLLDILLTSKIGKRYSAILQVHLVDMLRWGRRAHDNTLERMQTRTASHVLFTWRDRVDEERADAVRAEVSSLNPRATEVSLKKLALQLSALCAATGHETPPQFVGVGVRTNAENRFSVPGNIAEQHAGSSGTEGRFKIGNSALSSHGLHLLSHRHTAVQARLPGGLHPLQLVSWLQTLPDEVVRAKGIIEFRDGFGKFYYFQKVVDEVVFVAMPCPPPEGLTLALLVGIGLDAEALLSTIPQPAANSTALDPTCAISEVRT